MISLGFCDILRENAEIRGGKTMNEQMSMLEHTVPQPLPARLRPETIDEIVGQQHLLGRYHLQCPNKWGSGICWDRERSSGGSSSRTRCPP